jgi:hypothetical protein
LTIWLSNWLNGPGIVELKEIAVGGTGRKTRATRDATTGNLHQERRIGRFSDPNDSPLDACLIRVSTPQDLGGAVGLRLECRTARVGNVGILMPGLLNIHTGSDDAGEYHAAHFVFGDRLDGHTEPTRVFVGDGTH